MVGIGINIITRFSRKVVGQSWLIFHDRHGHRKFIPHLRNCFHSLHGHSHYKALASQTRLQIPILCSHSFQRCGISSFASSQSNADKTSQWVGSKEDGLTKEDLIKLIDEKEGTLNAMHQQIEQLKNNAGAAPLLKTLQQGVTMTENHLAEIFKKFGVEKYDPINEQFDGTKHKALFGVVDPTKPLHSVAVVQKAGYMLHDQVLRLAEVGVTVTADVDENKESQRITLERPRLVDMADGMADVYYLNRCLNRPKCDKDQKPLDNAGDELKEEISDIECSKLMTPNEQETNNLDSHLHTFDEGDNISDFGSSLDTIIKDDTISNSGFSSLDTIIKDDTISNSGSSLDTIIKDDTISDLGSTLDTVNEGDTTSNLDTIKEGFDTISDSVSKVGSFLNDIFWDSD